MIRNTMAFFLLAFMLVSCGGSSKDGNTPGLSSALSADEDKAIKEIISFYGGACEYGREKKMAIGEGNSMNFWIKFSQSSAIDSLANITELPASNMAYLFYKNLSEKSRYDNIDVELVLGDGSSIKYTYGKNDLSKVAGKMLLVNKVVGFMKNNQLTALDSCLQSDTSLFPFDKAKAFSYIRQSNKELGSVKDFVPYGFKFMHPAAGHHILHISGMMVRDKRNHFFSIYLDPDSVKDEVYAINYQI